MGVAVINYTYPDHQDETITTFIEKAEPYKGYWQDSEDNILNLAGSGKLIASPKRMEPGIATPHSSPLTPFQPSNLPTFQLSNLQLLKIASMR